MRDVVRLRLDIGGNDNDFVKRRWKNNMKQYSYTVIALLIFGISHYSYSQDILRECPITELSSSASEYDAQSLQTLQRNFLSYTPEVKLIPERLDLLLQYEEADQQFVTNAFYSNYCELVAQAKYGFSSEVKIAKRRSAIEQLNQRARFRASELDTRMLSNLPTHKGHIEYASYTLKGPAVEFKDPFARPESEPEPSALLRGAPYVITKANKYFIIASSMPTKEGAFKEALRLKRRAKDFDFVVYGPYQGNPNYAIMVATWLDKASAEAALELVHEKVIRGAVIWKCKGTNGLDC